MRRLGDSVDWSRERFTMDAGLSRAVQTIFKQLHDDGLIYRAERIINWCRQSRLKLSRYGDGDESIVVATSPTRPCSATPQSQFTTTTPGHVAGRPPIIADI